jgi:hypothetical protein
MVDNFFKVSFLVPISWAIKDHVEGPDGRALGITDWNLTRDQRTLSIETTQSIREVIKFLAPLVSGENIGLITQTTHYEPQWLN